MRNRDYFGGKKITVVGLARSGLSVANLLFDVAAAVRVTDNQDNAATRANAKKLKSPEIMVELGRHSREFIQGSDLVVVSPGVPDHALPLVLARDFNLPVISEIEVAAVLCPATIIAVTGSNGKTTVSTLIAEILQAAKKKVFLCGNIGTPFSSEVSQMKAGDFVSLEVSSFQLEKIRTFKPKIAVILNFSRNHLDRYRDIEEYLTAKKRIFMNQDAEDYLVLNAADPVLQEVASEAEAKVVNFCQEGDLNPNQAAVCTVASILGIEKELCLKVFREFKGLGHRLEFVARVKGVSFINDSKATTVEAAIWALRNINQPIILIAGGRDKGNDYNPLLDLLPEKVKEVILIGEAKERMEQTFKEIIRVSLSSSLEEAVDTAFGRSQSGDCVLLSPMCASFDMFSNYEERGEVFKKAVASLSAKEKSNYAPHH